ncbi:MAG: molybdopterin-synthase adenylyltransferase MoeB [Puniceicoccaceae bacterium]
MDDSRNPSDRYARQVILPGIGMEGQERLRQARVLLVGLGGLGSPAGMYLATAGVGTLGLADPDTVDASNLHRQILHPESHLGSSKIESARKRLLEHNASLKVQIIPDGITPQNAVQVFEDYDLIIDGTDNFPSRYLINDAACLTGKPVVHGSIFQYEGQVTLFHPSGGSPCYRCLFPSLPDAAMVPNCAEAGVLGTLCGLIGSWQAAEAIKWILGIGEPLAGRIKILDMLSGIDRIVHLDKDPDCPLCGSSPTIRTICSENYQLPSCPKGSRLDLEISVAEAARMIKEDHPPLFLDVREPHERKICRLENDLHIPAGELARSQENLPRDQPILIYCHRGTRSLYAARLLRENGFPEVQSLHGGIDQWAREIDPAMARYG